MKFEPLILHYVITTQHTNHHGNSTYIVLSQTSVLVRSFTVLSLDTYLTGLSFMVELVLGYSHRPDAFC